MDKYIQIHHKLPSFCVTKEPKDYKSTSGRKVVIIEGKVTTEIPGKCPSCGATLHKHQYHTITLQHSSLFGRLCFVKVKYIRCKCSKCNTLHSQKIPFKANNHRMTTYFENQVRGYVAQNFTLNDVSKVLGIHPNTVKAIDKDRLRAKLGDMKPRHYSKYIGVDEFLLHKGHRYATIVIDLTTGEILFCQKGKKKDQFKNFFKFVGNNWMNHVKAVAMDMNAQYDSALKEMYPDIDIVYDFFHVMKYYTDTVITDLRREEQNKAEAQGNKAQYKLLKGSRWLLLSSRKRLTEKDTEAYENNNRLRQRYTLRGLSLPPGERIMRSGSSIKLKTLLAANHKLLAVYVMKEELHEIFSYDNKEDAKAALKQWLSLAASSDIPQIRNFCLTINKRWEGILNHTVHHISTGKVEGTNNMIKTTRRKAYGFKDTEYFFMKITENSMRRKYCYKSHRNLF